MATLSLLAASWVAAALAPAGAGAAVHARGRQIRTDRLGAPRMFEAYDMVPLLKCMESTDVKACVESLNPWLTITQDGRVLLSEAAGAAFIGGTVGVVGTMVTALVKRDQVKDRLKCTYCEGTGQIPCGRCYGAAMIELRDPSAPDGVSRHECSTCESSGTVVCINCQGSGLQVPEEIMQKLGDSEVGFTEDDYIGLFDEVKFPEFNIADTAGEATATPVEERARITALSSNKKSEDNQDSPSDPTGGLG